MSSTKWNRSQHNSRSNEDHSNNGGKYYKDFDEEWALPQVPLQEPQDVPQEGTGTRARASLFAPSSSSFSPHISTHSRHETQNDPAPVVFGGDRSVNRDDVWSAYEDTGAAGAPAAGADEEMDIAGKQPPVGELTLGDGYARRASSSLQAPEGINFMDEEGEKQVFDEYAYLRGREARAGGGCGGCCLQLGSTMYRVVLLMTRDLVSSICEFIIPILFTIGTVILWAIFGNQAGPAAQYLSNNSIANFDYVMGTYRDSMCLSTPSSLAPTLPPCDASAIGTGELLCPRGVGIPLEMCYNASLRPQLLRAGQLFFEGTTAAVPALDDVIALQWVAMDASLPGGSVSDFYHGGRLLFAPDTAEVADLVEYFRNHSTLFDAVYGGTFPSVAAAKAEIGKITLEDPPVWAVVSAASLTRDSFDLLVQVNGSAIPSLSSIDAAWYLGGLNSDASQKFLTSGYASLQTTVYNYYMQRVLRAEAEEDAIRLTYTPMPTSAYDTRAFLAFGNALAPLILVLGFLFPVSQLTKRVVIEKELRIREAMLIMGLSETVMYLAWLLVYLVWFAAMTLIMSIIMVATYLGNTNFGYVFFLLFFFTMSAVALSGCMASLFSKARLAALLAPLIYFVLSIPLFAMQSVPPGAKYGITLLSPSALAVGMELLFKHESARDGKSIAALTFARDNPNLLVVFVMLIVDIVLYTLLMVYFDLVIPKDWGVSKNPCFCVIDPVKWCCCRNRKRGRRGSRNDSDDDDDEDDDVSGSGHRLNADDGRAPGGVFEDTDNETGGDATAAVRIIGLRKKYKRGGKSFLAVNNLYWSLREGEISVLLGHNGAGKTTTMNMMTGMVKPTRGDCVIYGHSVRRSLRAARREIGLCPQHNILWPQLTCREHLEYFASIKGLRGSARAAAVASMLKGVDLEEKVDYRSAALSGGQKRKLSVAIAFVGGSRLVFLDEPTAGMDVTARRHTWGLLKAMAQYHTILLTTHFMDEADLLGNTIAIMARGRLQCAGSSLFLKSRLGVGFIVTMSVVPHADRGRIAAVVQGHVPSAEPVGSGAGEVCFRLPTDSKPAFPALLADVEDRGKEIGVNAYALSATTLEEVFLKVAEGLEAEPSSNGGSGDHEQVDVSSAGQGAEASSVWNVQLETRRWMVFLMQFRAMMIKRFWNALRDRRTQFFQIVCPVACVLLAMLLTLVQLTDQTMIELTPAVYEEEVSVPVTAACDTLLGLSAASPMAANTAMDVWTDTTTEGLFDDKLLATHNTHALPRYGGLYCDAGAAAVSVFYNSTSNVEVPIQSSEAFMHRVARLLGPSGAPRMTTQAQALPQTKLQSAVTTSIYALMIAVIIMIPFTFIPSTFVGWIVKERECKARHLQNVSGLNFYVYWLSNFLFDMCCYIITVILVIIVFLIFKREEYVGKDAIGATIVLLLLYGVSGIFSAYALSFLFSKHTTAQNVVMLANFIIGFLLVLAIVALGFVASAEKAANVLRWFFRLVPAYCVGEGISNLASVTILTARGRGKTPWDMSVTGWPCVYMALEIPALVFLTLFVDHPGRRQRMRRFFRCGDDGEVASRDPNAPTDGHSTTIAAHHEGNNNNNSSSTHILQPGDRVAGEDVREEEAAVLSGARDGDLVSVQHLRKVYPNGKVAVRDLTFGVKPGEVFGFLGTNGAGKTTAISILCQEFSATSGRAAICGHDIATDSSSALRCIGYCPQFDACIDLLTVEEHLYLYTGVRGIVPAARKSVVEGLLKLCELGDYRKTKSRELSGGNRRKLSVALALVGGPRVVFFDEPSAGMDPVARRGLWTAIETVADNCAVVLTTHHLEEVEALAHRVAIMVDGALECIGNKTDLKQRFGSGFEVSVRLAAGGGGKGDVLLSSGSNESDNNNNSSGARGREGAGEAAAVSTAPRLEPAASEPRSSDSPSLPQTRRDRLLAVLRREFGTVTVLEERSGRLTLHLPRPEGQEQEFKLSRVFAALEAQQARADSGIVDYSVSQTSIEQVFMRISEEAERRAEEEERAEAEKKKNKKNKVCCCCCCGSDDKGVV